MPKGENEPWVRMEAAAADKECGVMQGHIPDHCGVCKAKVILHCPDCQIQVSGCTCTLQETIKEQEHFDTRLAEIERHEQIRDQLQGRGLWLPPA